MLWLQIGAILPHLDKNVPDPQCGRRCGRILHKRDQTGSPGYLRPYLVLDPEGHREMGIVEHL